MVRVCSALVWWRPGLLDKKGVVEFVHVRLAPDPTVMWMYRVLQMGLASASHEQILSLSWWLGRALLNDLFVL